MNTTLRNITLAIALLIPLTADGQTTGGSFGGSRWGSGSQTSSRPSSVGGFTGYRSPSSSPVTPTYRSPSVGATSTTRVNDRPSVGVVSPSHYGSDDIDTDTPEINPDDFSPEGVGIFLGIVGVGMIGAVIASLVQKIRGGSRRNRLFDRRW